MHPTRAVVTPAGVSNPTSEDIVGLARAGDVQARAQLVDTYYAPLSRYLLHMTNDRELAADLTQDVFLTAFRCLGQLKREAAFAPWLYRIARNAWYSRLRRRQLRRAISLDWLQTLGDRPETGARLDAIELYAERHDVHEAMAALSPTDREVLVLRHLAGFGGRELGGILGISANAAQRRLNRAEERFRTHYRGWDARP
jgi:RNA polymerase sigma-70 factor (ECF subfamily)